MSTTTTDRPAVDQVKVDRDLTEIIDLAEAVLTQAVHQAAALVEGHSLPGGEAMVALGPVADPGAWQRKVDKHEARWEAWAAEMRAQGWHLDDLDRPDPAADEDDDEHWPPLALLRYWSLQYRRATGYDYGQEPTLVSEAKFLKAVLGRIIETDPRAPRVARDINLARRRLESILKAGRRFEKSRVHCDRPTCETKPQLIKVRAPKYVHAWECRCCGTTIDDERACETCGRVYPAGSAKRCSRKTKKMKEPCGGKLVSTIRLDRCPNVWCGTVAPAEPVWVDDPESDRWRCPACQTYSDDTGYIGALATELRRDDTAKYVELRTAVSTLRALGRGDRTIRRWLASGPRAHDVCTRCDAQYDHQEYDTCPARNARDTDGQPVVCGGTLRTVWTGLNDPIIDAYCDPRTHQVYVWWPTLWHLHNTTQTRRRKAG